MDPQPADAQVQAPEQAVTNKPAPARDAASISPVAFLVASTFFMENLDGTVIATALPRNGRETMCGRPLGCKGFAA